MHDEVGWHAFNLWDLGHVQAVDCVFRLNNDLLLLSFEVKDHHLAPFIGLQGHQELILVNQYTVCHIDAREE